MARMFGWAPFDITVHARPVSKLKIFDDRRNRFPKIHREPGTKKNRFMISHSNCLGAFLA